MQRIDTAAEMLAAAQGWRAQGLRIGLVPTMGYLHEGHLSLMRALREQVDVLVVSIYVNPKQFGPNEDLDRYPRDPEGDLAKCEGVGVDAVFMPETLYSEEFRSKVIVEGLTSGLCGSDRPGHFDGVTTVVTRLLNLSGAHVAAFGEKDFQQLAVIRRMVLDLGLWVEVVGVPIARTEDGVARSSRNALLTKPDRERASCLHRALFAVRDAAVGGASDAGALIKLGRGMIDADNIDYFEIVDSVTLRPVVKIDRPCRALVAAKFGGVRLLDNVAIPAVV